MYKRNHCTYNSVCLKLLVLNTQNDLLSPFFDGIRIPGYAVTVYSIIGENKMQAYYAVCILHSMYRMRVHMYSFYNYFCKDLIKVDLLCTGLVFY